MMSRHALIAPHVQAFFAEHLCHHKRVSPKTIASSRDTFRLLLTFVKEATGKEPSALQIHDLDAPLVLHFLDYLERQRGNAIADVLLGVAEPGGRLPTTWPASEDGLPSVTPVDGVWPSDHFAVVAELQQ